MEILDSYQVGALFKKFFWVIDMFCVHQTKNDWKQKLINVWGDKKRRIDASFIRKIEELDWSKIPVLTLDDEKFEFQFNRYSMSRILHSRLPEERLYKHALYIHSNASAMKTNRKMRDRIWRFDAYSNLHWSKETRREQEALQNKQTYQVQQSITDSMYKRRNSKHHYGGAQNEPILLDSSEKSESDEIKMLRAKVE